MTEEKNKIDNLDINEKNTVTILISICEYCGKDFIPDKFHPNQKYCCKSCSSRKYREEEREKNRKYYQEHKEEIKKYRQEHKEERKEYDIKYRQEHREEIKEYHKKYYQEHKEEKREYRKKYHQEHKEEEREYGKKYRQEHKEEIKKYHLKTHNFKKGWSKPQFYEMYPTYEDFRNFFYKSLLYVKFTARILAVRGHNCQAKLEGCLGWGDEIDHLRSIYYNPEIALDPNNVEIVCVNCHNIRTKNRYNSYLKRKARGWS